MKKTNGENILKIETLNQQIELILTKVGLHKIMYDVQVEKALNLTHDDLKGMSAEECGMTAYTLKQYALYIQVETNKYQNVMGWAKRNIDALLAKEYSNIGDKYTKYEIKRNMLITMNSAATELYKQYIDAKIKYKALSNVSRNVSYIAETLLALQQTKRYK